MAEYPIAGRIPNSNARGRVRVAIVINFLTTYRESFYSKLLQVDWIDVTIFCHLPPRNLNINSIHTKFESNVRIIDGKFFFSEKAVLSQLPWRELFSTFDIVFVEGNPRYLSFALLASALQLAKRPVVLWTMIHSYRDSYLGLSTRMLWNRLFNRILVYSDAEADYLKQVGITARVVGINNGIDIDTIDLAARHWTDERLSRWQTDQAMEGKVLILSCARLEKKNKFDQVIPALKQAIKVMPNIIWCIVGGGPESETLQEMARVAGLERNVRLLGSIYAEEDLSPWFLTAHFLVHPGAIGLSLLHAFAYCLPVVTHSNARHHGPEFSAFRSGETGLTYLEDTPQGLADAILKMLSDPERCASMGQSGRNVVEQSFNTALMVERFLMMIDNPLSTASMSVTDR